MIMQNWLRQNRKSVIFLTIAILVLIAWYNRFILDDAFISFRYARNLAQGNGLVWNVGEYVEGYTNFLWTILMSLSFIFGIDPIIFSYILGLIFFTLSLWFSYKSMELLLQSSTQAILGIILLGTNYTFSSYATSGLETQMQAFLFVISIYYLIKFVQGERNFKLLFSLSLLESAAMLTRPDSFILIFITSIVIIWVLVKNYDDKKIIIQKSSYFFLPMILIIGIWLVWKISYYGSIIPNTYYAKTVNIVYIFGIYYLHKFFTVYFFFPELIMLILLIPSIIKKRYYSIIILISLVFLWLAYIIKIDGDFMEFRFIVPIMPFIILLTIWLLFEIINQKIVRITLITCIFLADIYHCVASAGIGSHKKFRMFLGGQIETIPQLADHLESYEKDWDTIGKKLREYFGDSSDVIIATSAAGAIPYYSGLRTIDMIGLNDKWIVHNGVIRSGSSSAHRFQSPLSYLVRRKTNIIIGHPKIYSKKLATDGYNSFSEFQKSIMKSKLRFLYLDCEFPKSAKVLGIPIDSDRTLFTIYLTPNKTVDKMIARYGWKTYPISQ